MFHIKHIFKKLKYTKAFESLRKDITTNAIARDSNMEIMHKIIEQ